MKTKMKTTTKQKVLGNYTGQDIVILDVKEENEDSEEIPKEREETNLKTKQPFNPQQLFAEVYREHKEEKEKSKSAAEEKPPLEDNVSIVKDIIKRQCMKNGSASRTRVVLEAGEEAVPPEAAEEIIIEMKLEGEIYEPYLGRIVRVNW